MNTDLGFMKNEYERIIKDLKIDSKYQQYKQFLMISFYGIEFILGKYCKLNMENYASEQIKNISVYDRFLIEIGHKHYIPDAPERFPVEVRLIGMIAIQTAVFLVMQKITNTLSTKSGGSDLFGMIGALMKGVNMIPSAPSTSTATPVKKVEKETAQPQTSRLAPPTNREKKDINNKDGPIEN